MKSNREIIVSALGARPPLDNPPPVGEHAVLRMIDFWRNQLAAVLPNRPDLIVLPEECDRYPEYTPEVYFYNEVLEHTYRKEQRTGALVSLFSLIAIIISVVGVFSLVTFECGYRRKESSIRKVAGATSWELVRMFCRKYLAILGICFVISIPVSIIVVRRWFESFAYHIPLYWWVFPAVFIAIAAITLATVIWQSWSTANENPVNNLRTD